MNQKLLEDFVKLPTSQHDMDTTEYHQLNTLSDTDILKDINVGACSASVDVGLQQSDFDSLLWEPPKATANKVVGQTQFEENWDSNVFPNGKPSMSSTKASCVEPLVQEPLPSWRIHAVPHTRETASETPRQSWNMTLSLSKDDCQTVQTELPEWLVGKNSSTQNTRTCRTIKATDANGEQCRLLFLGCGEMDNFDQFVDRTVIKQEVFDEVADDPMNDEKFGHASNQAGYAEFPLRAEGRLPVKEEPGIASSSKISSEAKDDVKEKLREIDRKYIEIPVLSNRASTSTTKTRRKQCIAAFCHTAPSIFPGPVWKNVDRSPKAENEQNLPLSTHSEVRCSERTRKKTLVKDEEHLIKALQQPDMDQRSDLDVKRAVPNKRKYTRKAHFSRTAQVLEQLNPSTLAENVPKKR